MRLARGRVHHQLLVIGLLQRQEQRLEMSALAPAGKALVHLGPGTQMRRQITPRRACFSDPQNRINEQAVITPGTPQYRGKMDNHALPLRIGQCMAVLCHQKSSK